MPPTTSPLAQATDGINNIHYDNQRAGVTFDYTRDTHNACIMESMLSLQFSAACNYSSLNNQDILEIYHKDKDEAIMNAIKRVTVGRHLIDLSTIGSKCEFLVATDPVTELMTVRLKYTKPFVYQPALCGDLSTEGPECRVAQTTSHDKTAQQICSPFEAGQFDNYFLYDPQRSSTKFVFVRHMFGMDAPPWNIASLHLLD